MNDFKTMEIAKTQQTKTKPGFLWLNMKPANFPIL